jgi:DNA-binding ferritin-like protein
MNITKEDMKSKIMDIARENKLPEAEVGAQGMDGISDIGLSGAEGEMGVDGSDELNPCVEIVSALINSMIQPQIFQWQTTGSGSYAAHKALQKYYEGVANLIDTLVESYQGKNGIMKNYKNETYINFESVDQLIGYFTKLDNTIESNRTQLKESYIQSQLDLFNELINGTLYKLKNLQ